MEIAIDSSNTQKFTISSDFTPAELASKSIFDLLGRTQIQKYEIDGLIVSSSSNDSYLGNIISEMVGIRPKFSTRIENLCNAGTSGIMLAYSLIKSELCTAVLVTGVEKQDSRGNKLTWDISRGRYDMPVHWASLYAQTHFRKYGTTEEDLAIISLKNHKNANKNSNAFFYDKHFTYSAILNSKMVVEPLKKFDCCYPCEGSSSILVLSEAMAKRTDLPIWIKGISQNNQGASFASISNHLDSIKSTRIAARDAFQQSNLEPKDIDIVEIHDAFTILELLAYEDIGFVQKGQGRKFIDKNSLYTNVRGGLLGCGHPIGATGIDQTNEIVLQLQGKAGLRQKKGCKSGLVHNMAAAGTSTTVIILQK
jgi:acetyl-CoA C-acetyltransferase